MVLVLMFSRIWKPQLTPWRALEHIHITQIHKHMFVFLCTHPTPYLHDHKCTNGTQVVANHSLEFISKNLFTTEVFFRAPPSNPLLSLFVTRIVTLQTMFSRFIRRNNIKMIITRKPLGVGEVSEKLPRKITFKISVEKFMNP